MFAKLTKLYTGSRFTIIKNANSLSKTIKRPVLSSYNDFSNSGYFRPSKFPKTNPNKNIPEDNSLPSEKAQDDEETKENPKWMRFFYEQFELTYDIDRALVSYNQGLELVARYIRNNYKNFKNSQ